MGPRPTDWCDLEVNKPSDSVARYGHDEHLPGGDVNAATMLPRVPAARCSREYLRPGGAFADQIDGSNGLGEARRSTVCDSGRWCTRGVS